MKGIVLAGGSGTRLHPITDSLDVVVNIAHTEANLIDQWHQLLGSRGLEYQPAASFGNSSTKLIGINP